MSLHKTCLIVGAGGSMPYGLPSGAHLRDLAVMGRSSQAARTARLYPVARWGGDEADFHDYRDADDHKSVSRAATDWNSYLAHAIGSAGILNERWQQFRNEFFEGRSRSIDRFIQFFEKEWGDVGRAYAAAVILNCERPVLLDKDWYDELLDQLIPRPDALHAGAVSVVTFNYDRSFEYYFSGACRHQFNLKPQEGEELFKRIEIEHVYGSLGLLEKVGYGFRSAIKHAVEEIDFMRNGAEHGKRKRINEIIADAGNVVFLGFGFADENLALFEPSSFEKKHVLTATSAGLSQNRMNAAKKRISGIKFFDGSILELLRDQDIFRAPNVPQATTAPPKHAPTENWATRGTGWRNGPGGWNL